MHGDLPYLLIHIEKCVAPSIIKLNQSNVCASYYRCGHENDVKFGSKEDSSPCRMFWNLFLHGVVFNVNCMQIASPISDFGMATLAISACMGLACQFDWRVALGEPG